MDLLWTPTHVPAKQQMGSVSPSPTYSLVRRKTLPGEGTAGGAYPLLPSYHTLTPTLSLPVLGEKFRFQSETRPCMPAHAEHTALPALGLSTEWAEREHRLGRGGLLLPLPAKTQDAHVEKSRRVHILALEAGDVGGDGLGPSPGGMRKQLRRPWVGGQEGSVHLETDVGFAQVKRQLPDSSRPLTV